MGDGDQHDGTLTCPECHGACSVSFWRWNEYRCPFCGPDYTVMDTLAANLAIAGFGCEAFWLGKQFTIHAMMDFPLPACNQRTCLLVGTTETAWLVVEPPGARE